MKTRSISARVLGGFPLVTGEFISPNPSPQPKMLVANTLISHIQRQHGSACCICVSTSLWKYALLPSSVVHTVALDALPDGSLTLCRLAIVFDATTRRSTGLGLGLS